MKFGQRQQKDTPPQEATPPTKQSFFKSEWPLFAYPALVVATLVALYAVNRSIRQGPVTPERGPNRPSQTTQTTTPDQPQPERPSAESRPAPKAPTPRRDPMMLSHTPGLAVSEGATALLRSLDQAVKAGDHATIKQSMRDLVALGDDAVGALAELIAGGDTETALWAAEALARIGTPIATSMLLETLALAEEGPYKEELAKQIATIANPESWPVLMDAFLESTNATAQRAVSTSLAAMADTPIVDEIVALYDAATTAEQAAQLTQLIAHISSPRASDSLLALAGDVSSMPQDPLQQATLEALGNIGDPQCVSYLLQKLEAAPPGQSSSLYTTITEIDQPQAQSALMYAAAGNKEVSVGQGQTAAICALENYPNTETYALLQRIATTEDDPAVVTAALRTLEQMEASTPILAETATSKAHTGVGL